MSNRGLDAVLLDLDGTLIYSNDAHARAFLLAAADIGIEVPTFDEVRRLIGMGGDKLIPEAFGFEADSARGQDLDERKGTIFREQFVPELRSTPGVRALLERLKKDGLRLVVATSASGDDLKHLLEAAGVADLIDACTSASDVGESKPAPDIVEAAVEAAKSVAERCIMIGDTPYDVEAAGRAGVRIVGVRTGGWSDDDLAGATVVYDHPAAILDQYAESVFGNIE